MMYEETGRDGRPETEAKKFKVWIGTPARSRSVIITAANQDAAVLAAIERLVIEGVDRDWLERYAANRDRRFGTCRVEQV